MDNVSSSGKVLINKRNTGIEVFAEQVRQIYDLAFFGIFATFANSLIVFFVMRDVLPQRSLALWLAALIVISTVRIATVLRFRKAEYGPDAASFWGRLFIAGLALSGMAWGSIAFLSLAEVSYTHQVFIVLVLGGMAAGAAATFSILKGGYLAYSIPALAPIAIKFFLMHDLFHYAMSMMLTLYGVLLWRIAVHHYRANRTSLLLRFENRSMIERLRSAKEKTEQMYEKLLVEINAKLKAEAELRAQHERLEKTVKERTIDLVEANERLKKEIDERKSVEQNLRESKERLALAEKAGYVGVFDLDLISGKAVWTEQLEELFGLPPGGLEGDYKAWAKRVHPDDRPQIEAQFRKWMSERREQVEYEYRLVRADGGIRWMAASAKISYLENGTPARMIGTTVDNTDRKNLDKEIMHMVHHDTLTGLPNRRLFTDIMNFEVVQARRNQQKFALLFLDLDRFKEINDTFGHTAGDELLKEVSKRLKNSIRESDAAARIGGDEFNIIIADITATEDITVTAQKIMDSLRKPFVIAGTELHITTSIGISIYPDDSDDIHSLFRYSDIAMYHAKERGRNLIQFYNPIINIRSTERIRFESYLRQTLKRGELVVYYQPQVAIQTRKIVAAEALVRWRHPEKGLLDSKQFVPSAEAVGFIAEMDEWVLRTACTEFKAWIDKGNNLSSLAVNLSAGIFQTEDFIETVSKILDETGFSPDHLEVEISESTAMGDIEHTIVLLTQLADKGIRVSIDDFGIGYSSLTYLKRLPIHRLKIDRSFVKDITTNSDDRAIIRAITAMAHSMKITVVAEGVETEEQLSFLSEAQCDEAQGYLFNKPLPLEEFTQVMAKRKAA